MNEYLKIALGAAITWVVSKILDQFTHLGQKTTISEQVSQPGQKTTILEQVAQPGQKKTFSWVKWCMGHFIAAGIAGFWLGLSMVSGLHTPGNIHVNIVWGLGIGIAQWAVLRTYLNIGPLWVIITVLGWGTVPICEIVRIPGEIHWFVAGLCVGVLQWLLLRRVCIRTIWWLPTNLFGWFAALSVGTASGFFMLRAQVEDPVAWVLGWGMVGLVGSIILGIPLIFMSPKPTKGQTE